MEGKNVVEKGAQATGITAALKGLWNEAHSRIWWRFTRSGLQLESVLQEPPHTDVSRTWASTVAFLVSSHSWTRDNIRGILPAIRTKRTGLLLSGPKFSSQMKVHFAFPLKIKVWRKREEAQNPSCLRSSVKFPVSDGLGCHVICCVFSGQRSAQPSTRTF